MSGGKGDAADAAEDAARLQQIAGEKGIAETRRQFELVQELQAPFYDIGAESLTRASRLLQGQESFEDQPFFRQLQEAQREGVERQAAAQGLLGGGSRLKALQQGDMASRQQFLGNLTGLGQFGSQAAGQLSQGAMGTGSQVANLLGGVGQAQASGIVGAANAESQAKGQTMGMLGTIGGAYAGGLAGQPAKGADVGNKLLSGGIGTKAPAP
jgi:hypothetical protein